MPLRPAIGVGITDGGFRRPRFYVDFSALSTGASASPGGLTIVRASKAGAENDGGANVFLADCANNNEGRIAKRGSFQGLRIERGMTNLITNARKPSLWAGAASSGTTTDDAAVGPDGLTKAAAHVISSGGYGRYFTSATLHPTGVSYTGSTWLKQNTLSSYQVNLADITGHCIGGTLAAGWNRYNIVLNPNNASGALVPVDGRDGSAIGGIAASAKNCFSDMMQLEAGPLSTFFDGTRAPERIYISDGSLLAPNGYMSMEITWSPTVSYTAAVLWGYGNMRIWGIAGDPNNYVEIVLATRKVKVVIGGQVEILPNALPSWSVDDVFVIRVNAGDGIPNGTYTYNGGAVTSLGSGSAQPYLFVSTAAIDLFCNSTTQQMDGIIKTLKVF